MESTPQKPSKAPQALKPLGSEWTTNLVMNLHAAGLLIGRGEMQICCWFLFVVFPWKSKNKPCRKKNGEMILFGRKSWCFGKNTQPEKKRMVGRVKTSRGLVEKRQPWRAVCLGEARGWDDGFV